MKNWLKILIITTLLLNSFSYGFEVSAQIFVSDIRVENIKDSQAILKWRSNEYTKSEVYYGLDAQNLNRKLSYTTYKRLHEVNLYNLDADEDYFYKITLYSKSGEKLDLYTRSFSTDNMEDTRSPKFLNTTIIQIIGNIVTLAWESNEKVSSEIHYWKKSESSEDKIIKKVGRYKKYNEYFLYDLDSYSQYYIKIIIKDKDNNQKSKTFSVNIYNTFNKNTELRLKNIEPLSSNTNLITSNQVTIKFKSNLAAQSYIKYGISPNRLNKKLDINDKKLATNHQITIDNLEANTTYYYDIYLNNSIYRKKLNYKGLSFTTKGNVLGIKESTKNLDSDHDQLSNTLEIAIGTNPYDPDTDNDGYRDGTEVKNGYDPLGPGRWNKKIDFFYGQPRLDLSYEQSKAIELKNSIDKKIKYIHINPNAWHMLVNAYIYGDYPVEAIVMYIKLNGYTVHPDISWHSWKNSSQYLKYEKYIK